MDYYQKTVEEEKASQGAIYERNCYIDIAEDLVAGILLQQIVHWCLPLTGHHQTGLVFRDNFYWLAKGRRDWWASCRITPEQYDRAIAILREKNFVVTANFRLDGNKTTHIRINLDVLPELSKGLAPASKTSFSPLTKEGIIYLMHDTANQSLKIGFTQNLSKRIRQHQSSNPSLKLFYSFRATSEDERKLHGDLYPFRIHGTSEWYSTQEDAIERIMWGIPFWFDRAA